MCFKHVPKQTRRKPNDHVEQMMLLGYHPTCAYKLYDPRMKKVVISRDVTMDETRCWNWETNSTEALKRLVMNLEDDQHKKSSVVARNQPRRSQRERHTPQTLNNYEMFPDTTITTEGDLV